jgi:tetratricopeptide (TPR) repeat protein
MRPRVIDARFAPDLDVMRTRRRAAVTERSDVATELAREARRLAADSRYEEAAQCYRRVLETLSPDHWWAPAARQGYGEVLVRLERHAEALLQFETGLQEELRQDHNERSPAVVLARCRLGEQLCRMGRPGHALDVVAPALASGTPNPGPEVVFGDALRLLGRRDEARGAALAAIGKAGEDHAAELRRHFRDLLD